GRGRRDRSPSGRRGSSPSPAAPVGRPRRGSRHWPVRGPTSAPGVRQRPARGRRRSALGSGKPAGRTGREGRGYHVLGGPFAAHALVGHWKGALVAHSETKSSAGFRVAHRPHTEGPASARRVFLCGTAHNGPTVR